MCRAAVSQFASDINQFFDDPTRGELQSQNDNGITYTSILVNNAVEAFNDRALISNAVNVNLGGPYQRVGVDATTDRLDRELFSFNFFRLGTISTDPFPSTDDQRRIVIVNGNTRELLYSFTPTGSSSQVRSAVAAEKDTIIAAINSVMPNAPEPIEITVNNLERVESTLIIDFDSNEGLADFQFHASSNLEGQFDLNLTTVTDVVETSAGSFQAMVDITGYEDRLFLRIEHEEL